MSDFRNLLFERTHPSGKEIIAVMGAGGKTSLLNILGEELAGVNRRVLLTSLTKSEIDTSRKTFTLDTVVKNEVPLLFKEYNPLRLMKSAGENGKLNGIEAEDIMSLMSEFDAAIIECDGARKLSLKAHTDFDPSVPGFATRLIIIAAADVVDTRLTDGKVHRPDLFKQIWRITDDYILDAGFIAEVLTTKRGYHLKNPSEVKPVYFINKADTHPAQAEALAETVYCKSQRPVFYGSLLESYFRRFE